MSFIVTFMFILPPLYGASVHTNCLKKCSAMCVLDSIRFGLSPVSFHFYRQGISLYQAGRWWICLMDQHDYIWFMGDPRWAQWAFGICKGKAKQHLQIIMWAVTIILFAIFLVVIISLVRIQTWKGSVWRIELNPAEICWYNSAINVSPACSFYYMDYNVKN